MKHTVSVVCSADGCRERTRLTIGTYGSSATWLCGRHNEPDRLLSMTHLLVVCEMKAVKVAYSGGGFLDGLFWVGGKITSGFTSGDGYKAFASDFPEGTRLEVTARVVLP